jgi:predicted transcriptional regulator
METEFHTLAPDDPLDKVIDLTLAGTQKDFPVMLHGEMVGVLSQADFLRGLQEEYGRNTRVDSVMKKCIQSAQYDEPLESVLERLQTGECRLIAVMRSGKLAGIIDMDNIMELIKIQSALHQH